MWQSVNSMCRSASPTLSSSTKQNTGVKDNQEHYSCFQIDARLGNNLKVCFTIWTTSILTHARHRADSHESTPVRHRGRCENRKPSKGSATASTRPWPSSLAPFRSPPPPCEQNVSDQLSTSLVARCGHRQGLFVEGVAVETGCGGEPGRESERVIHLLRRELEEREKKRERANMGYAPVIS